MIFILFVDHEKINYNAWFFQKKRLTSNSSEVNVELPTTNVAIPILENVDVPIQENVDVSIPENADVPISQIQFQRIDLDSLDYSLLILGCVFEKKKISLIFAPPSLKSCIRPWFEAWAMVEFVCLEFLVEVVVFVHSSFFY